MTATVDAFMRLEDVPLGYWPIIVGQEGQGGGGVHLDQDNQPYALVDLTSDWTITASHECLEMLADPYIDLSVFAMATDTTGTLYAYEICDAVEAEQYDVDGVPVSDFVTPAWFEPAAAGPFDHLGRTSAPFE